MTRMPEVGDLVDEVFRVESVLDEGSFGAIYRVEDTLEDRVLALKVQKAGTENPDEVRARFEREARLLHGLDHAHVVDLLYYGETEQGLPYMAMEFLEGTDLGRVLRSGIELEAGQIRRIADETLAALEAAHEIGIVHRDLKPGNIFIAEAAGERRIKVLDFGFAKAVDNDDERFVTRPETLVGSPSYMAPELVDKEDVGPHTDLYALGLIVAEMISGEPVVQIENVVKTVRFQSSDEVVELPPEVERSPFAELVRKAVRKDPAARYRSAAEMRRDLESIDLQRDSRELRSPVEQKGERSSPFGETPVVEAALEGGSPREGPLGERISPEGSDLYEMPEPEGTPEAPDGGREEPSMDEEGLRATGIVWFAGLLAVAVAVGLVVFLV